MLKFQPRYLDIAPRGSWGFRANTDGPFCPRKSRSVLDFLIQPAAIQIPKGWVNGHTGRHPGADIEIGDRFGFFTFDQINELTLSYADRLESEDIEVLLEAFERPEAST